MERARNLRVIVALCKGGSTALIHSLAHADNVTCYLQTVKSGQRTRGVPDYSVYFVQHPGVVLSKETIGHSSRADCTLAVFPDDEAIRLTTPLFLLRDPVDTRAAWARAGWGSSDYFDLAYAHLLDLYQHACAVAPATTAVRYEAFGDDCVGSFRGLCRALGIDYSDAMIHWRYRFPQGSPVIWQPDVQNDFDRGQSDSARASQGFSYRRTEHGLPRGEVLRVERLFRERYEAVPSALPAPTA